MLEPTTLKILAAAFSVVGSGILAWRVSRILRALSLVALAHEVNINQFVASHRGGGEITIFENSPKHVEQAKGTWLLVTGFMLLALSGALNIVALIP